jgi:hypothetical protein
MSEESLDLSTFYRKEGDAFWCPICDYPTIGEPGGYGICSICEWEDDGTYQLDDCSGPNGPYTVREARANFRAYLTSYRPDHREAFAPSVSRSHLKRAYMALIDAYRVEQFVQAPNDTTKAPKLWEQAEVALHLIR